MRENLQLVHFQLTRSCNLRCWFCGQWGKQGFFRDDSGTALEMADWLKIAQELSTLPKLPSIILWGGEPLMYPHFDELARTLCAMGFPLGMVTNGTLIHKHLDTCRTCFRQIFVSVDGPEDIHDGIRGAGVFQKVKENLALLRGGRAKLSLNTVLTEAVMTRLDETLDAFATLQPEEVLLQEMIALSPKEILNYKAWLAEAFSQQADEIASWEGQSFSDPGRQNRITAVTAGRKDRFSVIYKPHGEACGKKCTSPLHHAHVTWKGNVTFCTDFYDFSAGNVREQPLLDIFENPVSQRFREEIQKGNCAACGHCSWRGSQAFHL